MAKNRSVQKEKVDINKTTIIGIQIKEFSFVEPQESNPQELKFSYKIHIHIKVDQPEDNVIMAITITINIVNTDNIVSKIVTHTAFHLPGIGEFFNARTKDFFPPQDILNKFVSEAIATTRGILLEKFKGSILANLILPIISDINSLKLTKNQPE